MKDGDRMGADGSVFFFATLLLKGVSEFQKRILCFYSETSY